MLPPWITAMIAFGELLSVLTQDDLNNNATQIGAVYEAIAACGTQGLPQAEKASHPGPATNTKPQPPSGKPVH